MIYKILRIVKSSLPVVLLAAACSLQGAESEAVISIKEDINKEVVNYQQVESQADAMVKEANHAFFKQDYKNAIDKYLKAIKLLEQLKANGSNYFDEQIDTCKEQVYRSYYYWARKIAMEADKLSEAKQFNRAIKMCREAIAIYPPCKKRMEKRIAELQKQQKVVEYRTAATVGKLLPDKSDKEYQIQIMLKKGEAYLKAGRYYKAKEQFERILLIDPYQLEAIDRLRVANIHLDSTAEPRHRSFAKERIAEASWKSVMPIRPSVVAGKGNELSEGPVLKVTSNDAIMKKLKNIIIPKIIFEDVSLPAAVNHLRRISKQLDPEGVGVNIFLMLKKPEVGEDETAAKSTNNDVGGAPGEDDLLADDETAGSDTADDTGGEEPIPTVTLRLLTSKSLGQVIHYVCQSAGVKYRVERYAVVIARKNIPLDELETRIYPVEESMLSSIGDDLRQYFVDSGIPFPDGAKVIYDRRISRLIVTNTPENLAKMEKLIHEQLNSPDPQVLIQAKFIEIEQNDLNELSFNYTLSRTLPPQDSGRASGKLEFGANDRLNRTTGHDVFRYITSSSKGYNFMATISAVDQADSRDLLASPRIVTSDGEEASIRMIKEVYYPSDWSDATTTTTTADNISTYTYMSAIPEFDEPTELGIVLKVTPKVDLDKRTITLHMKPTVQTFVGWTDYSYTVTNPDGTILPVKLTREIIAERTVDTQVTVYDGETIVLGGIIRDGVEQVKDKIPILGDLPLVGRMFQSRYTTSKKINLLIFLTCRLMRPDGTLFDPSTKSRGKPFFGRVE